MSEEKENLPDEEQGVFDEEITRHIYPFTYEEAKDLCSYFYSEVIRKLQNV